MTNDIAPEMEVTIMPAEMRQLVSNLISNALDAMPRGGALSLHCNTADDDRRVRLTISDTGHGIDSGSLDRIFEPFFTTKNDVGVGLGLWVAKRIAEEHSGNLSVESCENGSTFTLVIPAEPRVRESSISV
jgi:signal transduction histidine kinase